MIRAFKRLFIITALIFYAFEPLCEFHPASVLPALFFHAASLAQPVAYKAPFAPGAETCKLLVPTQRLVLAYCAVATPRYIKTVFSAPPVLLWAVVAVSERYGDVGTAELFAAGASRTSTARESHRRTTTHTPFYAPGVIKPEGIAMVAEFGSRRGWY